MLDLFQLCSEFKCEKLTKFCKEAIEPCITIDNCCVIMRKLCDIGESLSNSEVEEALKSACMSFILLNYSHLIN